MTIKSSHVHINSRLPLWPLENVCLGNHGSYTQHDKGQLKHVYRRGEGMPMIFLTKIDPTQSPRFFQCLEQAIFAENPMSIFKLVPGMMLKDHISQCHMGPCHHGIASEMHASL